MKKLFWILSLISYAAWGQEGAEEFASRITAENLKQDLTIFASDEFEGRETGTRGEKLAAEFIADAYKKAELTPPVNGSYFMPVPLYQPQRMETFIKVEKISAQDPASLTYIGNDDGSFDGPLIYAGLGQPQALEKTDVKDKAVLVHLNASPTILYPKASALASDIYQRGAKAVLFIATSKEKISDLNTGHYSKGSVSLDVPKFQKGFFVVDEKLASKWYRCSPKKLLDAALASPQKLEAWPHKTIACQGGSKVIDIKSENVAGFLEGTDKKDEVIVISAHLDHIGIDSGTGDVINNGADDDGSGIVSMLQIAHAFSAAKKEGHSPRRSLLFLAMTGEEEGLLGSSYYVSHPLVPLSNTVADLNIDMVGRSDNTHKNAEDYVYVIGADKLSLDLHKINETANDNFTHLKLDYAYNDVKHPERLYQRSDHWNFAKNNIPIAFFFDGIHEDYHKVSDEVSKINFPLLAKRATLVFHTAWEIANREERIRNNAVNAVQVEKVED